MGYIPVLVLAIVFLLIAIRQVGRWKLRIWQIMLGGAVAVLLLGQISLGEAIRAIDTEVMLFLFGMFVVGEALNESGYLNAVSFRFFGRARDGKELILLILVSMAFFSAFLMNDTIAIIGTPLVLCFARRCNISGKSVLLALCFAITLGSVASPIGNPQNLLITSYSGMEDPFLTFIVYLGIPTLISLIAAYFLLLFFFRDEVAQCQVAMKSEPVPDPGLARLTRISLALIVVMIGLRAGLEIAGVLTLPLTVIAITAAAPILIFSPKRVRIFRSIDWYTLIFFVAMFVLMQAVFSSGFFQSVFDLSGVSSVPVILVVSVVVSQFISNVPFVALFQPVILQSGMTTAQMLSLAAGSTIAGNLTILGAASNVIVIQHAEREGETLTFWEFFKIGLPLTVINIAVYALFLCLF